MRCIRTLHLLATGNNQTVLGLTLQLTTLAVTGKVRHHEGSAICKDAPEVIYSTRRSSFRWSRPDETSCRPSGGNAPKRKLATEQLGSGAAAQQLTKRTG